MVITRSQVRDIAKLDALIDRRLDDITGDTGEVRAAARAYYLGLIQEDLELSQDVILNECFDSAEGMTIGFIAGYEACRRNHGGE